MSRKVQMFPILLAFIFVFKVVKTCINYVPKSYWYFGSALYQVEVAINKFQIAKIN